MNDAPSSVREALRVRIARAGGIALLVAGLLLLAVVLPAEFAVDPLGTGARLGLLTLGQVGAQVAALKDTAAGGGQAATVVGQGKPFAHEERDFLLQPNGSLEYKYRLDKGETLLFAWHATQSVEDQFHAEPDGAPKGYAESYEKGRKPAASGTLMAPFTGIHGWYWKNSTDKPLTVTLSTAGFYNLSHEFTSSGVKNTSFN